MNQPNATFARPELSFFGGNGSIPASMAEARRASSSSNVSGCLNLRPPSVASVLIGAIFLFYHEKKRGFEAGQLLEGAWERCRTE